MAFINKIFEQLDIGDTIIVPGVPECIWPQFRGDTEWVVREKNPDKTVWVKGLGGVVVRMDEYKVKV